MQRVPRVGRQVLSCQWGCTVNSSELRAAIERAGLDRDALSGLYIDVIGYCPFEDDSSNTPESVAAVLAEYADEIDTND